MDLSKQVTAPRVLAAGVIAIVISFAVLYCKAASPYWKLTPDSTTYVLGAQSLAEGRGYKEAGSPAVLLPPGTSAFLAAAWIVGGKSYRALNAEVVLFALASFAICFLVFREPLGTGGSAAVVLLCLGSAELFQRTTFLLSEIFFVFLSLLAFWWYQRGSAAGTILSTLAAVMVRSVGVCLAVAFLLDSLIRTPRRWKRAAAFGIPLLFLVAWEWRNRRLGWSYTGLMIQKEPWVPASGHMTVWGMLVRLAGNRAYVPALEDVLTNGLTQHMRWAVVPGIVLGALIAAGFWRLSLNWKSAGSQTAVGIYAILFSLTVALYWPLVFVRLFLPLLPFLFAFLVAGVQQVARRTAPKWVYAAATVFLVWYLVTGYRADVRLVAEDRIPAFPGQLVRYPDSEDLERLALWLKEHTRESDIYACQHPSLVGVITGRHGVNYVMTGEPGRLEDSLRSKHARFLLLTMNSGPDREVSRVADRSANLHLTRQEGKAKLYELTAGENQP